MKDMEIIINHFDNYPLRGTKYIDYLNFKKIIYMLIDNNTIHKKNIFDRAKNTETILSITDNMNSYSPLGQLGVGLNYFKPLHLQNVPLDPNYISGFIEGDGSFIVELSGIRQNRISLSIDQYYSNKLLLESFKSILNINSLLVLNKKTNVLKLASSGDKYFKTFLIPFLIQNPLHGYKLIQLYKILLILIIKDSTHKSNSIKCDIEIKNI